ncbi:multidrug/Oligosaccharidyl-lipid/Polysaccharide flippase [Lentinula raphanica]|uniref:Multidrug/Oligosaccharidyl-lipid/Polysaccharide flippase n=1 Tax=Lentinula raphanica TaxID=153919 RepID=A0AA38P577_9AGAR|nr:multidrug/Oligosaccharidyl-lipid/Polysaccharide flippase [Lentinula raphanica]KAJ3772306.1 multidrug/Oligosaccharidyl-lipid/Polysaccharide flippase [Lentinula raphanica]KAJ3836558.1 multidrug/Oligosaccharidyl-lipid/Polysaccharide flippase [Lentinula raphanica]KAJ3966722.1 multidrug/Oligosaccharidyl-lipid/Polysaccharide flippase [Lentinula raphanica]
MDENSEPASSANTIYETTPLLPKRRQRERASLRLIWSEALIVIKYAVPIFGINILEYSLVVVSVLSIGHISTTALAAITIGEMTVNVTGLSIIMGFASALDTVLPSAWTSDRPELVGLWTQRMMLIVVLALVPIITLWLNAEAVLLKLNQEPEVARLAALYLRCMCIGIPAFTFNCVSRRYLQCQGLFSVPTRIIIVIAPINVLLNYLLVWGPPSTRLGFIGAPLATSISYYLLSLSYIVYGVFWVDRKAWYPLTIDNLQGVFGWRNLGFLFKLGLAGVGQTVSEWWAWDIVALVASQLGSDVVLASQSILVVTSSTTWQGPFALGIAASIRIGNLLGERDSVRAGAAAKGVVVVGFVIAGLMSVVLLAVRNSFAYLFNNDPEVVSLVASVIPILAAFQIFDATAGITSGILRARSKQVIGAILNISAYYVFGIPFGVYLAFSSSTHMGLSGLWVGLTVALVYCASFGVIMSVWTPDWDKEVEKVEKRVEREGEREREREEREGGFSRARSDTLSVVSDDRRSRSRSRIWTEDEESRLGYAESVRSTRDSSED